MNAYRVPKREIWADAVVLGVGRTRLRLFVAQSALGHSGFERPSDLVNGETIFIPVVDVAGVPAIVRRDMLLAVSVAAEEEKLEDPAADSTRLQVEITFENGESVRGTLAFVQPEGRRRLGDYLNDCEAFFPVRDGATVHLVNKGRVVRVAVVR